MALLLGPGFVPHRIVAGLLEAVEQAWLASSGHQTDLEWTRPAR